ncbi:MAG TPA: DegQ family serine endoprotease [Candidatus Deferrimicrobiaceae bacterium]|nr:DegQ family serine endoprotease [Candidatus Deferrimicrobiaceae bacterium]
MIGKGKVVVLLIAAVAAGVILSAGLDLSPLTSAFWGEKGKEKGGEVGVLPSGKVVPVEGIPALAKEVSPAVVNISTTQVVRFSRPRMRSPYGHDPFEDFFNNFFGNMPREQKRRSLGSGFLVSEDGFILTNNHVVEKADEITVTLLDKEELRAEVIGTDPKTDIALIKIKAGKKLPYVRLGDSEGLEIGEWVVAIGNPFGLGHTVTTGIVSAKGRVIGSGPYDDFIQTDASINPGNSGGPLFNLKGEVVGINTAIIQGGQGIGFATPVHLAKSVLGQLREKGKVTRGWLGVYIQRLTPDMAETLNVPGKKGALVADVTKDGPAEKSGIRSGDVITSFDGKEVSDEHELPQIVASTKPGKKVDVVVVREGKEVRIPVTIAEMEPEAGQRRAAGPDLTKGLGLTVQDITPAIARHLDIENRKGVLVSSVEPGSPADDAGFREGDVIRAINRATVNDSKEFEALIKKMKEEKTILFLVERGEGRIFLAVKNR